LADYRAKATTVREKYPFYSWACKNVKGYKTRAGNVAFRKKCLELVKGNEEYSRQLWIMCSRDILFWINTFVFTYDPRRVPFSTVVPFDTYDFQDVAIDELKQAIELGYDGLIDKSRTMGVSWICLTVFTWFWMFKDYASFRMLSRNEDLVDKTDDPDCLFWKVLFILEHLPSFLRPPKNYIHLSILNEDNRSTVTGCTTTSDAARGGRCTALFADEFAAVPDGDGIEKATQAVTKCRIFNSTHQGANTAFYRLTQGSIKKLVLHWSLHPLYNKGLYYSDKTGRVIRCDDFKGKVTVTRREFDYPDNYHFRKDGKLRSPWYDNECDRASHPMQIAQELDMDAFASDFQAFPGELIQEIEKEDVRRPFLTGMLSFDEQSLDPIEFTEGENGFLKLWVNLDAYGKMPEDLTVAAGIDISAGTGASNSAITFANIKTGEKIGEYVNPNTMPESFASVAIALCKWFNDAFMIPDGAGPGRTFCDTVIKLGYRDLFYRRNEEGLTVKVSDKPGVFLNPKEKRIVLERYRYCLKNKIFIQRSHEANQECLSYIYISGSEIEHSSAKNTVDPSGAGASHGDRCVADALACKGVELLQGDKKSATPTVIPVNCYAARKRDREDKLKAKSMW